MREPPPPDWRMPPGVNRGLWDYLHDPGVARNYDAGLAGTVVVWRAAFLWLSDRGRAAGLRWRGRTGRGRFSAANVCGEPAGRLLLWT